MEIIVRVYRDEIGAFALTRFGRRSESVHAELIFVVASTEKDARRADCLPNLFERARCMCAHHNLDPRRVIGLESEMSPIR